MGLFDLLAQFLQYFIELIPVPSQRPWSNSYCIVDAYKVGVHEVNRPFIYVPVLDDVVYLPKHEVTLTTETQTVTTADEVTVSVESEFSFEISDPITLRQCLGSEGYEARLIMIVRGEVEEHYRSHNFSHILSMPPESLFDEIADRLDVYGVNLVDLATQDRSACTSLRHYGVNIEGGVSL